MTSADAVADNRLELGGKNRGVVKGCRRRVMCLNARLQGFTYYTMRKTR